MLPLKARIASHGGEGVRSCERVKGTSSVLQTRGLAVDELVVVLWCVEEGRRRQPNSLGFMTVSAHLAEPLPFLVSLISFYGPCT